METIHDVLRELIGHFGGGAKYDAAEKIISEDEAKVEDDAREDVEQLRAELAEVRAQVRDLVPDKADEKPVQATTTTEGQA